LGTDAGNNCCSEGKGSSTVTTDIIRHHPDCAHGARKGIATPVVPKKRQILTAVASKSWQTDRTAHQASEALEKGGVYAKVVIGSRPIWEISGYRSQLCRGDNLWSELIHRAVWVIMRRRLIHILLAVLILDPSHEGL
jgi:hypothetical protein